MKRLLMNAIGLAAAATLSGCATVYCVSESGPTPLQPAESGCPASRKPAVSVKAKPADASARKLAASMQASVEGHLAATRRFDVRPRPPVDSLVTLSVSRREAARLSDWRAYEGTVDASVTDAASGKTLARKSFKAVGERALDEAKAEGFVKDGLLGQVTVWLAGALPAKKIAQPGGCPGPEQAMTTMTIRPSDMPADAQEALLVQRRFMDAVASHPGVVSCVLASQSPERGEYAFSVIYEPSSFPDGLLNTIVLDTPSLGNGVKLEISR